MRQQLTLTILLVSTLLGACGTRGPLTLPPQQEKAAQTAPQAARAMAIAAFNRTDLNTTQDHAL